MNIIERQNIISYTIRKEQKELIFGESEIIEEIEVEIELNCYSKIEINKAVKFEIKIFEYDISQFEYIVKYIRATNESIFLEAFRVL